MFVSVPLCQWRPNLYSDPTSFSQMLLLVLTHDLKVFGGLPTCMGTYKLSGLPKKCIFPPHTKHHTSTFLIMLLLPLPPPGLQRFGHISRLSATLLARARLAQGVLCRVALCSRQDPLPSRMWVSVCEKQCLLWLYLFDVWVLSIISLWFLISIPIYTTWYVMLLLACRGSVGMRTCQRDHMSMQ